MVGGCGLNRGEGGGGNGGGRNGSPRHGGMGKEGAATGGRRRWSLQVKSSSAWGEAGGGVGVGTAEREVWVGEGDQGRGEGGGAAWVGKSEKGSVLHDARVWLASVCLGDVGSIWCGRLRSA